MTVVVWLMLGMALTVAFGWYGTRQGAPVNGDGAPCPDCDAPEGVPCHVACSSFWD